jgi:hypothetical protein
MATITVRKLDANWDPIQGQGLACFISDAEAVAQIIATRLKLFQGEWYQDLSAGVPYFQDFLSKSASPQARNVFTLALQTNILGAPYVTSISGVETNWDSAERAYSFSCTANTLFGPVPVQFPPQVG